MKLDLSLSLPGRRHGQTIVYDRSAYMSVTLGTLTLGGVADIDIAASASITFDALTLAGVSDIDIAASSSMTLDELALSSTSLLTGTASVWRASGYAFGVPQKQTATDPAPGNDDELILIY